MHAESAFDGQPQRLSCRRVANLALQTCSLALELGTPGVERGKSLGLGNADRTTPNDRKRDNDERAQYECDDASAPESYAAFRHARSLALRERGFADASSGLALTPRFVNSVPSALPRQVH